GDGPVRVAQEEVRVLGGDWDADRLLQAAHVPAADRAWVAFLRVVQSAEAFEGIHGRPSRDLSPVKPYTERMSMMRPAHLRSILSFGRAFCRSATSSSRNPHP